MERNHSTNAKTVLKLSNMESKQLTRECIQTALLHLMKDKTFEKITVTDIINRSGVSRAGFYRNYASKEEVLEEFAQITYEELANFIMDEKLQTNPYQWYLELFSTIKNGAATFNLLVQAKAPHQYIFRVESLIEPLFVFESAKERYRSLAITNALKEIAIDWFKNGMQESPEEMAELFVELFHL